LTEAQAEIARLRTLLGKDSLVADEQLIAFLRSSGNSQEALRTVKETREKFPNEPSLVRTEAAILTDLGKVEEAVGLLRSKIVNKTKEISVPQSLIADFLSHLTISDLFLKAGRGADSVGAARQALELAQNDEMTRIALLTLATAQNAAGNFRDAEASLRDILKKEPENPTALNNLGYFLLERNERLTEALSLIRRAVSGDPTNPSFLDSLGWAYFKLNQFDEAERHLSEAARRNPESAAIQEHLGDLYEKQGKIEQAKTAWQKALMLLKQPEEIAKIRAKLNKK
jgi:predicted Zn-dependent protease